MAEKLDRLISIIVPVERRPELSTERLTRLVDLLDRRFTHFEIILVASSPDAVAPLPPRLSRLHPNLRLLLLSRRTSFHIKVFAGFETAIGDYIVVLPPLESPEMVLPGIVEQCMHGCDIIYGVRNGRAKARSRGAGYRWLGKIFHWYARNYAGIDISSNITEVRCISRRALNAITSIPNGYQHFRYFSSIVGFETAYYPYPANSDSLRLRSAIDLVHEGIGILIENTTHPLKIFSYLCFGFSFLMLALLGWELLQPSGGWPLLWYVMPAGAVLGLMGLGLGMRYLAALIDRGRPVPPYYIQDELAGSETLTTEFRLNVVERS